MSDDSANFLPRGPVEATGLTRRWKVGSVLSGLILLVLIGFAWQTDSLVAAAATASTLAAAALAMVLATTYRMLKQTRTELARVKEDLDSFSNLVPLFLWRATADGKLDYLSARYTEITGERNQVAVTDQTWVDHIHPEDYEEFDRRWKESLATGADVRTLFRALHQDGIYRWMSGQGRALRDPETDSVKRWYGVVFDVDTEIRATREVQRLASSLDERVRERTRQLEESRERFRVLFEDMSIAYAEQDVREAKKMIDDLKARGVSNFQRFVAENPDFIDRCLAAIKVNQVNDRLLHLMGYQDHAELVIKPPTENAVDSRRVMIQQLEAMFEDRHHFTTTATLLGKNNRRVTVAVGVNVAQDWSISLSTHIDITERLQAQEMLAASREELARANRAAAIGAVSTSLAHELNQPLLALNVASQTAKRWLTRDPPALSDALQALERVSVNAERMNGIMRTTREKLVRRTTRLQQIDLHELLTETDKLIEPELRRRNVILKVCCAPDASRVRAERIELQQVVVNLVMNSADALRGSAGDKLVEINVRRTGENQVTISVSDNGPGITEADLPHIFEPFYTTKSGGMGMGLRICHSIVESFGGEIKAENAPGGGAIFRFSLPISPIDGEAELVNSIS